MIKQLNIFTILTLASLGFGAAYAQDKTCLEKAQELEGKAEDLKVNAGQNGDNSEVTFIQDEIIKPLKKVIRKNDEDRCNDFYDRWCDRYKTSYQTVEGKSTTCP